MINGEEIKGFPFELNEPLGQGGFARVIRGKFHRGEAAFKFVPLINRDRYRYNDMDAIGCHEYCQQEPVKDIQTIHTYELSLIRKR